MQAIAIVKISVRLDDIKWMTFLISAVQYFIYSYPYLVPKVT